MSKVKTTAVGTTNRSNNLSLQESADSQSLAIGSGVIRKKCNRMGTALWR